MGILGRIFGRGKKPDPVLKPLPRGHRGIAARDLRPGMQDLSAANVGKWKTLSADEVEDFVYGGEILFVHSSNVAAAQYHISEKKMMVEFLNGSAYLYSDVSEAEALEFAKAQSKGGWVWDHLRVRGSKTLHRKKFIKIK